MNAKIGLNDFKRQWRIIAEPVQSALERVGASGHYILGPEVERFEMALAQFWGIEQVIGVGNGMDALEIGLRCLGLRRGDKVLTTPLSAFATTLAIIRAGGIPVFVDVDERGCVDLDLCRQVLNSDTSIRFFVPVHLYGFPLDLAELARLKSDFDLAVLEDCAQAIGAEANGRTVGSVGQAAAVSFYPTKNVGALGDAGALVTANPEIAAKARSLRNYGQRSLYVHTDLGLNSRLDELQAAILSSALLPNLTTWTQARRKTAETYVAQLNTPHIRPLNASNGTTPVWHLFPVSVPEGMRDQMRAHLDSLGISTGVHYPFVIPDQAALGKSGQFEVTGELNQARKLAGCEVSLPVHPFLDESEVFSVIDACNSWRR